MSAKPVRVKLAKLELDGRTFPDGCPNCLATPAATPVALHWGRGAGHHGGAAGGMLWPHCERCARDERTTFRRQMVVQAFVILGLAGALLLAPLVGLGVVTPLRRSFGGPIAIASLALVPVAYLGYFLVRRRSIGPEGAATFGSGVKLVYAGKHLLAKGYALDLKFWNPEYARRFVDLHRANVVE